MDSKDLKDEGITVGAAKKNEEAVKYDINFSAQDFDYDEELEKIMSAIKKPNILITGAAGVGKSSAVNQLFGKKVAETGEGKVVAKDVQKYASPDLNVVLYDSEGYDTAAETDENYLETVIGFIDRQADEADIGKHIHEVWHCISAANKRVTDMDVEIVNEVRSRNIPVAIILNQIDGADEEEFASLIRCCEETFEGIEHFAVCCLADGAMREDLKRRLQWEELLDWAAKNLDDSLKAGFVRSLEGAIARKRNVVLEEIIPIYTALAAGAGAIPISFSDAMVLIPLQLKMSMHIMNTFGLKSLTGIESRSIESFAAAQVGKLAARMLKGGVLKLIPFVGSWVGGVINAYVAGSFTHAMGRAVCELGCKYSRDTVLEGKKISLADAFNTSALFGSL